MKKFRPRATYANVASTMALLLAASGTALATHESIKSSDVVNNSLTGADIKGSAATKTKAAVNGTLTTHDLKDGTVATADLGDGAVTSATVADGTLSKDDIGGNAVGDDELAANVVNSYHVVDGAITTYDIQDGDIWGSDIHDNTIDGSKVCDNCLGGDDIAESTLSNVDAKTVNGYGLNEMMTVYDVPWAVIDGDATTPSIVRGSMAYSVSRTGTGQYEVTFLGDVSGCGYFATPALQTGQIAVGRDLDNASNVLVATTNANASPANADFNLLVLC